MKKQYNKAYTSHMRLDIAGCLERFKRKKIKFFDNDDGTPASDADVRAELKKALSEGKKFVPIGDCYRFDPYHKGCKGHIKALLPPFDKMEEIEKEYELFKKNLCH